MDVYVVFKDKAAIKVLSYCGDMSPSAFTVYGLDSVTFTSL